MGYFETDCQLCGASPAIARIRAPHEPESSSWDYSGTMFIEGEPSLLCGEGSGCYILTAEGEQVRSGDEGGEYASGEHIAGPGCVSGEGYSGWRIGLEEMKGCRAIQCLVQKDDDWEEEEDDEEWEKKGNYFLSGSGDGSADEVGHSRAEMSIELRTSTNSVTGATGQSRAGKTWYERGVAFQLHGRWR